MLVPLLISNNTGLSSYLEENIQCYKFEPNILEIKEVFYKVEKSNGNYRFLSNNSRETYLKKFSIQKYLKTIEKYFL